MRLKWLWRREGNARVENLSTSFRLEAAELPLRHVTLCVGQNVGPPATPFGLPGKHACGCRPWLLGKLLHKFRQRTLPSLLQARVSSILECRSQDEGQLALDLKINLAPSPPVHPDWSIGVQMTHPGHRLGPSRHHPNHSPLGCSACNSAMLRWMVPISKLGPTLVRVMFSHDPSRDATTRCCPLECL